LYGIVLLVGSYSGTYGDHTKCPTSICPRSIRCDSSNLFSSANNKTIINTIGFANPNIYEHPKTQNLKKIFCTKKKEIPKVKREGMVACESFPTLISSSDLIRCEDAGNDNAGISDKTSLSLEKGLGV
jgi:hypothetical protein